MNLDLRKDSMPCLSFSYHKNIRVLPVTVPVSSIISYVTTIFYPFYVSVIEKKILDCCACAAMSGVPGLVDI